ncbi:MAG: hypothetical protein AAF208_14350 [Cyanobacteria bacterium P01_A01_bin.45]
MVQQDNLKQGVLLNLEESRFTINESNNESKIPNVQNVAVASPQSFQSSQDEILKDCDGRSLMIDIGSLSSSSILQESSQIDAANISNVSDTSKNSSTRDNCSQGYLNYISIKLDNLRCFETVEKQYQNQGVIFDNTIAIEPSNPAFPTQFHQFVLMGSPKGGCMEATFIKPVRSVRAYVTSSRRLEFCGYNRDRQLVDKAVLQGGNLANSGSNINPGSLLSISGNEIYNVTFSTFDGQFIVDGFSYCY